MMKLNLPQLCANDCNSVVLTSLMYTAAEEGIKNHNQSIEVIMLTGHGSAASGIEAMEKGAFDYLMKPVDLKELLEKINSADEKRSKA